MSTFRNDHNGFPFSDTPVLLNLMRKIRNRRVYVTKLTRLAASHISFCQFPASGGRSGIKMKSAPALT